MIDHRLSDSRRRTRAASAALTCVALALALTAAATPVAASTTPTVTFTLLTALPDRLEVGESAEIGVRVQSSEPFAMAIALSDAYYPGRAVRFDGSAAQANATSADLYLTLTARESTAGLGPVQGWPVDEVWAAGVAPLAVRVGARFAGGAVFSDSYLFGLTVP